MTSDEARERFSAAYDGALPADEQAEFEAALGRDETLAAQYAGFRALLEATRSDLSHADPAPNLLPGVQRKLRRRSRGRYYPDRFSEQSGKLLSPMTLVLVMAALLVVGWLAMRSLRSLDDVGPRLPRPDSQSEASAP